MVSMLPAAILALLFILGLLQRPWWVVIVGATAFFTMTVDYLLYRARGQGRVADQSSLIRSAGRVAGDCLAYSSLAYIAGWMFASVAIG